MLSYWVKCSLPFQQIERIFTNAGIYTEEHPPNLWSGIAILMISFDRNIVLVLFSAGILIGFLLSDAATWGIVCFSSHLCLIW
jgi:hypothetical protein